MRLLLCTLALAAVTIFGVSFIDAPVHSVVQPVPTEVAHAADLDLNLLPGFKAERLYSPSAADQGSWVAMTTDDQGRLITSDQYGHLYRVTPPAIGADSADIVVEQLDVEIGHANGLLWAFNSLYVVVNSREGLGGHDSGLYRLRDTNGDDQLDEIEQLETFVGSGEHGPHALRLSPDGESIYILAGNHTNILPEYDTYLVPPVWQEDNLLPVILDPGGHAVERKAPGGWLARFSPDGSDWTLISAGYRNPYDFDFNAHGDPLVFDADMEWDLGMPWYRPIRVCHAVSGSDYGWRTGSGKWVPDYPDTLPPIVNIGQGSPTGVMMGTGANFPTPFQERLFIFDWSFGTMYTVEMEPEGGSYTGGFEEFLSGVPLPLTDGVIGPDGAMYFATGGRRLESHLYRVYYDGDEDTSPPTTTDLPEEHQLRQELEAFHGGPADGALDAAWPNLDHADRFVRYAARIAVEHQPVDTWRERALDESDAGTQIQALIALARHTSESDHDAVLSALSELDVQALSARQQYDVLRAYSLAFIRLGEPSDAQKAEIAAALNPLLPSENNVLNRELVRVLSYLDAPEVAEKGVALLANVDPEGHTNMLSEEVSARSEQYGRTILAMLENLPAPQAISYANSLSHVKSGWTLDLREQYFRWFHDALNSKGGASYTGFLDQMRLAALEHVPDDDLEALGGLAGQFVNTTGTSFADLPQPEGPGVAWNASDVGGLLRQAMEEDRDFDFERGERMYAAALCASCHAMRGVGGNTGPDLTQIGTRFSGRDLVQSLISPSRTISDQYGATLFTMNDGSTVVGRVMAENDTTVTLNQNPFDSNQSVTVNLDEVASREPSPVSTMPPGLLNRLNREEMLDLMAYLMAGGDAEHEIYTGESEEEETEGQ